MSTNTKAILILGGSYAGISAAHYMVKHVIPALPNKNDYSITLISESTQFFCRPAAPRAIISEDAFPKDKRLFVPLEEIFGHYKNPPVSLYHGRVSKVDHRKRTVTVTLAETGKKEIELEYHALIIATGITTESPLMSMSGDYTRTIKAWASFQKNLSVAKSIVIAGGGPTSVETAGEIAQFFKNERKTTPKPTISLITKCTDLLPHLPPALSLKAAEQLSKLGVIIMKSRHVEKVVVHNSETATSSDQIQWNKCVDPVTIYLDGNQKVEADLYIPATGVTPNTDFLDPELLDHAGYIMVDPSTLQVQDAGPRIYALGHVGSSQPRAIHAIMKQAPVVCENLKQDLLRSESNTSENPVAYRKYEPESSITQLVVIGKKGVGIASGWTVPSFFVWLIKGRDYWLGMTPSIWNGNQFSKSI